MPRDISLDTYREVLEERLVCIEVTEKLQGSVEMLAGKLGFPSMRVPTINLSERTEPVAEAARDNRQTP